MSEHYKNLHQIMTVRVLGADVAWDGNGCTIEGSSLKKFVSSKASQIDSFIVSTGLVKDLLVMVRFAQDGATIEVNACSQNDHLEGFENEISLVAKELHSRFLKHQKSLEESCNPAASNQPEETRSLKSKSDRAAEDALAKVLSGPAGAKMEIEFYDSGKEVMHSTKPRPTPLNELNHNTEEKVTGDVRLFDERSQKVTLFNLVGIVGYVTLDVDFQQDRKTLLDAQKEYRQVVVKFTPARTQPGERARTGKLASIESVGEANEKLL